MCCDVKMCYIVFASTSLHLTFIVVASIASRVSGRWWRRLYSVSTVAAGGHASFVDLYRGHVPFLLSGKVLRSNRTVSMPLFCARRRIACVRFVSIIYSIT